ncbi:MULTISPECIES: helix-turn-helix domain-containing protein [Cyanophyceae]|uniref:winged helix-turn-helix transcriptional regulator n=1 Tax=Cyanophyceae TaxID=3028117 RepID=UPI001685BFF3|nr:MULTISPECIES: helix-turn-helix domain-containing protein [Cyanophyceae]MBD1915565.1 winged helix-turn-helix transcriptional regulator [Phormidium sp. FACHB-77]MBD2031875.1 winged helix-turn-helix transcriptional regulator [Phormidium sp. FACHB-322]MBD2050625.1 winged helix-turn-helix transcriptional regulator [Leptolyngbya sp. FACHB-60]
MSEIATEGTEFVKATLKVLGGKWKILILWHLRDEAKRFSELKRLMPDVSEKVLTQQLRELEADGIVLRISHLSKSPKVEYSFTDYGRSLVPVLQSLCQWGEVHLALYSDPSRQ